MRSHRTTILAQVLATALAAPALAQETPPPALAQGDAPCSTPCSAAGVLVFTVADFAAANPNTALDIINRLPGFTLSSGDQVRGFAGAAGNVLIDGQRPTIKTDSLSDTLGRIPVGQVERIELIRGGAPGIDMQGRTVVVNVVRKRIDTFTQVASVRSYIFADTGHTIPGWSYEAHKRSGDHQIDIQLGRGTSYDDSVGFGSRTTFDAASGDTLFQKSETEADGMVHSGRINYKGPLAGGVFSANALAATDEFKDEEHFFSSATNERYVSRSANDRYELGLNYKRPLATRLEAEVLALGKFAKGAEDDTGVDDASASIFHVQADAGESIGRGILRYAPSTSLQFEGGGEFAYNYRKQQIALSVDGAPVALPASDVKVEETRGEGFAQGTWRATPDLSFEAGVRVERSTITQSGDTSKERSFTYPKPRLAATWSLDKDDQLRFRIEREVGQLNFQDFASAVDLNSNVLSAGNADLRPDKTWVYEVAFEKRFWDAGAVVLTLRHEAITDVMDRYPFLVLVDANGDGIPDDADGDGAPDQQLVSGPGNIGDGTNNVVQLNVTAPLKRFGISGGELKADALWQNSEVTDPLTHEKRRISSQRPNNITVNFRQDLPAYKVTWGLTWFAGWSERRYLLEEIQRLDLRNYYEAFVEYKPSRRFTLRAELKNFNPYSFTIERDIFDGPRGSSMLDTVQVEQRNSQVIGMLSGRWSFE